MKKIIIFLLVLILVVVGIVVGSVIVVYANLENDTDDTPISLYTADASKQSIISSTLANGFDLSDKNYIDITLNEEELNILIFCIIREKINSKYLPIANSSDFDDEKNYVWKTTLDSSTPLVGGKGLVIKSVYAKIDGSQLKLFMPALVGNKVSCVELYLSFEEDSESFSLIIDTLKIGKIDLASKGAKRVVKLASKVGLTDEKIEEKISGKDLKFDVSLENLKIGVTKDSLAKFLNTTITENITSSEVTRDTLISLADMLTSKENDILDLGIFNDRFGVRCDLAKADVDAKQLILNSEYANYNEGLFITSVTQSFAISNISSDDPKITISEDDFNGMLFAKSNGYQDFKASFEIPNTTASILVAINGIDIDLNPEEMTISIILNLNGLKTVIEVKGKVSGNNTETVIIALDDDVAIGKGESELTASYIKASSKFISAILSEKIKEMDLMDYDKETNSLIINASSFNEMLKVEGGAGLPMQAKSLEVTDAGLVVHVTITDLGVKATLDVVTGAISNFIETTTIDESDFDTTDPEQAQAVSDVLTNIQTSSEAIKAGNISEEDTNSLIEAISLLSDENKEALYSQVEDSILTSDLEELYNSLFGK